jgi:hypothetical protein
MSLLSLPILLAVGLAIYGLWDKRQYSHQRKNVLRVFFLHAGALRMGEIVERSGGRIEYHPRIYRDLVLMVREGLLRRQEGPRRNGRERPSYQYVLTGRGRAVGADIAASRLYR